MLNKNSDAKFSIYNNPQLYDDIMWWKEDDISFWQSIIKKYNIESVLEICCGTGRIGIPLIQSGIKYYGLDNSKSFIDFFESKTSNYDKKKLIVADANSFNLDQKFDLILIGFNSLAHLLTNQSATSCFNSIRRHMHDNSLFGIDIFMPTHQLTSNIDSNKTDLMDFIDSSTQKKMNIIESTQYNQDTEVAHILWEFQNKLNQIEFMYNFEMRMFFPDTLNRLLIDSKFNIDHFYGNYQFEKFNEDSEKQIYLCSK